MPAYIIADISVTDPEAYEAYKQQVGATIAEYGGRYLARGGAAEVLEGDWTPNRLVVLEFPDMDRLKAWYESKAYAGPKAIRQGAAVSRVVAVEGAP